jgi:hypothetical protein
MEGTWREYLSFRRMITPIFIQVIFWVIAVIAVIGGLVAIGDDRAGQGILLILLGPLFARIYAEILIVLFRINDDVHAIRMRGTAEPTQKPPAGTPAPGAPGATPGIPSGS